jgi:hypothetical protein
VRVWLTTKLLRHPDHTGRAAPDEARRIRKTFAHPENPPTRAVTNHAYDGDLGQDFGCEREGRGQVRPDDEYRRAARDTPCRYDQLLVRATNSIRASLVSRLQVQLGRREPSWGTYRRSDQLQVTLIGRFWVSLPVLLLLLLLSVDLTTSGNRINTAGSFKSETDVEN